MASSSVRQNDYGVLLALAEKGALRHPVKFNSADLARHLHVSQQTASRWLARLTRLGYLERKHNQLKLTHQAQLELEDARKSLAGAFEAAETFQMEGKVTPGMGEGKYYLSKTEYQTQLQKLLGYKVFPGTLNIKLSDAQSGTAKKTLSARPNIEMEPFHKEGRTFGGAWLYPCAITNVKNGKSATGAIIVPHKTHHGPEIVELVSENFLRKKLGLKNGDAVEIAVD